MERLSFRKISALIIVILLLVNLKAISFFFRTTFSWFAASIEGLNNFSEGAQTAIAFTSVLLVVVLIYNTINK